MEVVVGIAWAAVAGSSLVGPGEGRRTVGVDCQSRASQRRNGQVGACASRARCRTHLLRILRAALLGIATLLRIATLLGIAALLVVAIVVVG